MELSYGTVDRAMYTLFLSMCGGISWGEPAAVAYFLGPIYLWFFLFFISFTIFSVLNIVTGVFVDGAITQANEDRSLIAHKAELAQKALSEELISVLSEIDTDGSGFLTIEEWTGA